MRKYTIQEFFVWVFVSRVYNIIFVMNPVIMTLYAKISDQELVRLIKREDQIAFTELYNRYWEKLFSVAFHRIGNQHDAEEIVQDVFYSIWKRRLTLELQYQISTYLSMAVKYQIINRMAKEHVRKKHIENAPVTGEVGVNSTDLWLSEKELMFRLEQCVSKLPKRCRLVFELRRNQEKSNREIARKLNIAEKTVEAHMTKALMTLRDSLQISTPLIMALLGM